MFSRKKLKPEHKAILKKLEAHLIENPDLRFLQAVVNLSFTSEHSIHLYHVSDYEFLRLIKENT